MPACAGLTRRLAAPESGEGRTPLRSAQKQTPAGPGAVSWSLWARLGQGGAGDECQGGTAAMQATSDAAIAPVEAGG